MTTMSNSSLWSFLLVSLAGCYTYAPIDVRVIDASTNRPLAGMEIAADYGRFMEFFRPKLDHALTDMNGVATLTVCTNYKGRDTMLISLRDSPYLLDQDMPATTINVPVAGIRKASGSRYRVDLAVLSIGEYRRRYPAK